MKISIVIPVFNNELNLGSTVEKVIDLSNALGNKGYRFECIFVDDGSEDNSLQILSELFKKNQELDIFRIIKLTKNFGQYYATEAGISKASGDYIGYISADLQDPINLFIEMVDRLDDKIKLVIARRDKRKDAGVGKFFAQFTHYLIQKLINSDFPKGGYDFCLFDKCVSEQILNARDRNSELALLLISFGFKHEVIDYTRQKRTLGKSGWTFSKKVKLFIDTFASNSNFPLRLISIIGIISTAISVIHFLVMLVLLWIGQNTFQGWSTVVLVLTFYSGITLLSIGTVGEYLWRVLDGVKNRERFIIEKEIGFKID